MKQLHTEEPMNIRPNRPDARDSCPSVPADFDSEHVDCQVRTRHWNFAVVCGIAVRDRQEPAALLECMQQLAVPCERSGNYWSARHRHGDWQWTNFLTTVHLRREWICNLASASLKTQCILFMDFSRLSQYDTFSIFYLIFDC